MSPEQFVRDLLSEAIREELVFPAIIEGGADLSPQSLSSGDLLVLAQMARSWKLCLSLPTALECEGIPPPNEKESPIE